MAKTLAKISHKAALERIHFLQRDNDAGKQILRERFDEITSLQKRNAELIHWRDEARTNAAEWKSSASTLEGKLGEARKERDNALRAIEKLSGQLDRCIGYIAAHHQEHPAPEATPVKTETRAVEEYINRDRGASKPITGWRHDLGLDTGWRV